MPRGWPLPGDRPPPPGTDPEADPDERERDVFTMAELVAAFDIGRVNPNPARFDLKKCTAINADHIRWLTATELQRRLAAPLQEAGLLGDPVTDAEQQLLASVAPLIAERMQTLADAAPMIGFLFCDEDAFAVDERDAKLLTGPGQAVVGAARDALQDLDDWDAAGIEATLRASLIDGLGLKPRVAFGPVRVATSGRRVSPPLFESLELLGRERTLRRLEAAQQE